MNELRHHRRAFTLVELLVVIGIIALLICILLPALTRVRKSANELRSMSNLRQLLVGYAMYVQENHGSVPFGHTPSTVNGDPVLVYDPVSHQNFAYPVSDRYPWRLVNEVANVWGVIHRDEMLPSIPGPADMPADAFLEAYTLSLDPAYGINSAYVGGDTSYEGFIGDVPNIGKHVVFKATEVRHSSKLIVFADSQVANVPSLVGQGYHVLTPPHAFGLNWTAANDVIKPTNSAFVMGLPIGWYTSRVVTGFFDGHVEPMQPTDLQDMRYWANLADTPDYDFTP